MPGTILETSGARIAPITKEVLRNFDRKIVVIIEIIEFPSSTSLQCLFETVIICHSVVGLFFPVYSSSLQG